MAKCPVCGQEITHLILDDYSLAVINKSFKATYNKDADSLELEDRGYEDIVDYRDTLKETFYCPKCDTEVAGSHDEAVELLKEGDKHGMVSQL